MRLDDRFLFYALRNPETRAAIKARGYGSAQPNISPALIESVPIPLPPLREQRRIAATLGTLDDKIDLNRRMNRTLESTARAIFKSWFVDFDPVRGKTESGEVRLPPDLAALFPDSLVQSDARELPAGWRQGRLGDVAVQARDSVRPEDIRPRTPYFGLEHLPKRSIALADWHLGPIPEGLLRRMTKS